jgi:hypothetical protein
VPKSIWIQVDCTVGCIRSSRILATVARVDRTTTMTRYLAVFNSSEWDRGRKEWYPSTLKSLWPLEGISASLMMPTSMSLTIRRFSRVSFLPLERIPSAFQVITRRILSRPPGLPGGRSEVLMLFLGSTAAAAA